MEDKTAPSKRALVIDDDASIGMIVSMALKISGWDVEVANSGRGGLRAARSFSPDVILLDQQMPEMTGAETLAALRRSGDETPVLMLTAACGDDMTRSLLDAGAARVIAKPFNPMTLAKQLDEVLGAEMPAHASAPAPLPGDVRLKYGMQLSAELTALARLVEAPSPDLGRIRAEAHRISGTAGAFGYSAASSCARSVLVAVDGGEDLPLLSGAILAVRPIL